MKAGRLIEVLKQVSPDTEVMCGVTTEDAPTLFTINLFDLEKTQKYEVKSVLTKPNDNKYCTLLIKKYEDLTAKDFILQLLDVDNQKPIEGKLFIQKEMFLIVKEVYANLEDELSFIAYNYGPYSKKLTYLLEDLEKDSLIEIDNSDGNNKYRITDAGREYLKKKTFADDIKRKIHNLKSGSNKLGYKGLLRYVYFTYPEYFKIIIKK